MTIKLRFRYWYDEVDCMSHLLIIDRDTEEIVGHYESNGPIDPKNLNLDLGPMN